LILHNKMKNLSSCRQKSGGPGACTSRRGVGRSSASL